MTQSETEPDPRATPMLCILVLCSLALILPGYFSVYAPAVTHLNHIVKTTEQLFVPPTNETVTCGTVGCLQITYQFGIVLQGARVISNYSSIRCAVEDQICQVGFYSLLLASCQTVWYDDREPQASITSDPTYPAVYYVNRGGGIVMFVFGGMFSFAAICCIPHAIGEMLEEKRARAAAKRTAAISTNSQQFEWATTRFL